MRGATTRNTVRILRRSNDADGNIPPQSRRERISGQALLTEAERRARGSSIAGADEDAIGSLTSVDQEVEDRAVAFRDLEVEPVLVPRCREVERHGVARLAEAVVVLGAGRVRVQHGAGSGPNATLESVRRAV